MKIFTGKVISVRGDGTIGVSVGRVVVHPLYKKRLRRDKRYLVHDETSAKVGDTVKFVASKPYSKLKRWKVVKETK